MVLKVEVVKKRIAYNILLERKKSKQNLGCKISKPCQKVNVYSDLEPVSSPVKMPFSQNSHSHHPSFVVHLDHLRIHLSSPSYPSPQSHDACRFNKLEISIHTIKKKITPINQPFITGFFQKRRPIQPVTLLFEGLNFWSFIRKYKYISGIPKLTIKSYI